MLHINPLTSHRHRHDLSQKEAARLVGCGNSHKLALYEQGKRLPTLPKAFSLAAAYRTSVEALFPALASRVHTETERRWKTLLRTRSVYDPKPDKQTVLAIYLATRKVGVAVFQAPTPAPSDPAPADR